MTGDQTEDPTSEHMTTTESVEEHFSSSGGDYDANPDDS